MQLIDALDEATVSKVVDKDGSLIKEGIEAVVRVAKKRVEKDDGLEWKQRMNGLERIVFQARREANELKMLTCGLLGNHGALEGFRCWANSRQGDLIKALTVAKTERDKIGLEMMMPFDEEKFMRVSSDEAPL